MRRLFLLGVMLVAIAASGGRAIAADAFGAWTNGLPTGWVEGPTCDPYVDFNCTPSKAVMALKSGVNGPCDPYVNYKCLDDYLGDNVVGRFFRYYELEWGKGVAPSDPSAPPGRRSDAAWPPTPQSSPPMPFTEWPYGGTQNIGVTRPNSVDSPLMVAIANTAVGKAMNDAHIQVYGWVDPAGNISTNNVKPAGNAPAAYDYTPNTIQLDQAVIYIERLADTVQMDHVDWGFRLSALYGVDYRYTTAYGLFSYQLLNHNFVNGYDFPMVYTDIYVPVLQGMDIRVGRFISIPDIEAQLAPNNYTYVHSMTYSFDNYTNTGIEVTTALTKNWIIQTGVSVGSDTMPWNSGAHHDQSYVTPGSNAADLFLASIRFSRVHRCSRTPGRWRRPLWVSAGPAMTAKTTSTWSLMPSTADNGATTTCNGSAAPTITRLNDYWHIAFESWNLHENNVPNLNNPAAAAIVAGGGTPFSPQIMPFNSPNAALCQQLDGADLHAPTRKRS